VLTKTTAPTGQRSDEGRDKYKRDVHVLPFPFPWACSPSAFATIPSISFKFSQNLYILQLPLGRRLLHKSLQQCLLLQQQLQHVSQLRIQMNCGFVERQCGGRGCRGTRVWLGRWFGKGLYARSVPAMNEMDEGRCLNPQRKHIFP